ncbi:MAG: ATP synthase F0 subunit B [Deltaproteobacteria bacterium]|nr:ATP synthase F0 subunit B [Deltaproteobacteria bacterium]MBW2447617.1 ATP synthase F0 subunit B [Deltaproteobacteria bacterium]
MSRALAATSAALLAALLLGAGPAHASDGLVIVPDPAKLIPLMILFVLMIAPVNRLILQPLLAVLDERDERIAGARARAEQIAKRADETLASYEAHIATARAESELERRGTLEQARGRHAERVAEERGVGETRVAEARAEVATALEQARTQLEAQAGDLAKQAAERMLGRSL